MRITVNWELCESNALCAAIAPHIFEVDDDDMLTVLVDAPDPADYPLVERAVSSCPKQALSIAD